ncbi:MAG: hypothetical protein RIG82_12430 [Phycisphaeraceae bacterium]
MMKKMLGAAALAAFATPAFALTPLVTIMDEDFESYLGEVDPQAAVDAVWGDGDFFQFLSADVNSFNFPVGGQTVNNTPGGAASVGFGATTAGGSGSSVTFADIAGLDPAYHNYVPTDANPLFISFDIFDDGTHGNTRRTLGLRQGGGADNIVEMGFYNSFDNSGDLTEAFPAIGYRQILWADTGHGSSGPNWQAFDLTTQNLDENDDPIFIQIEDPENPGSFIDSDDSSIPNASATNFIPDGEPGVWHRFTLTVGETSQTFTLDYLADGIVDAEVVETGNAPTANGIGSVRIGGPSFITSGGNPVYWDNILIQVMEAAVGITGDFNADTLVDADDIDLLTEAIRNGSTDLLFDLDGSTTVDADDLAEMIATVLGTVEGDANLDFAVDLIDLSALASNFGLTAGWAGGNFNTDTVVDLIDLSLLASSFGTGVAAPEPTSAALIGLAGLALVRRR